MSHGAQIGGSIRRRLVLQLLVVAAILSGLLYFTVRSVANQAVEATQDSILGSAAIAIAEELRGGDEALVIDIPYAAFSMLGAVGEDRVFYRILADDRTETGYADLPLPQRPLSGLSAIYYSASYDDADLRLAAVERSVLVAGANVRVVVVVGQTRTAKQAIVGRMANRAAALGLGFFAIAAALAVLTARSVLAPLANLAEAVGRRGPQDLRPVTRPVPLELVPFVAALNGFIGRLGVALSRTETFIAEAAHHIRTPLATVRAQAEIALRQAGDDRIRATLRSVIRAVDDSARSAGQLLDHATVVYRSDQRADEDIDLGALVEAVLRSFAPTAELKDIALTADRPEQPVMAWGDRLLIESALRNLVDNAIKYSPPDTEVTVELREAKLRAILRVLDRGRGLAGMDASGLTGRFKRGANVEDVIGSGLGLTIVREVARAQRGTFKISQRKGGGTCAELSIPLR